MNMIWTQTAYIRSAALFVSENHEIRMAGIPENVIALHFSKPELISAVSRPNWDHGFDMPMWKYEVKVRFHAQSEEIASRNAWKRLESIVSRLSFVASAPIEIESYGGVNNSSDLPIAGETYTMISLCNQQGWAGREPVILTEEDFRTFLPSLLIPKTPDDSNNERLSRSMRWLQQSHFAKSPVDEFMCLILAFEGVSHLIKQPVKQFWKCGSCHQEMSHCPNCHASTEWSGSGKTAMKDFVLNEIDGDHKWSASDWKGVWEIRNTLFHGTHDLSFEQQGVAVSYLPKLEAAVVIAIKGLLGLPSNAPPRSVRQRNPHYGMSLTVKWTHNADSPPKSTL